MNQPAQILVVDDEKDTVEILSRQLGKQNYQVLKAYSGHESLELLKKFKPDLILMDIMMPGMNGFETIRIIRETIREFIPIIIVTASKDDTESITRGFTAGANDYIVIPCHEEELLARIKAMLRIKELHDALEEKNRKLTAAYAELEKTRATLTQSEKLAVVGRLAGGVAHDFNNMLVVINGHAEVALETLEPSVPAYADIREILKASRRSASLVQKLLTFARKEIISPQAMDLNATVADVLKMIGQLIGEDIKLLWQPAADPCPVKMDPAQIAQVLANLAVNARDAIGGVGQVIIETGNTEFDEDYCRTHNNFIPGRYVMLVVSDDGCGMDKETLGRLFEPFFTTKPLGQGTGLGLATVYGIVMQNNGFISVDSEPGKGTTFKIYLPRHDADKVSIAQSPSYAKAPTGTETVLLVEDEPAVRELTTTLLERLGYTVLATGSPNEAIRMVEKHDSKIHLLVTDVVMPEMNGLDLWQQLGAMRPDMKCLFVSGYAANIIANRNVLDEGIRFLQKPFSRDVFAVKLREALSGPGSHKHKGN